MRLSLGLPLHGTLRELAESVSRLVSSIAAGWNVNHTADGTHKFDWTRTSFQSGAFGAASGMTWTVGSSDVAVDRWRLVGTAMEWTLECQTTSTGGVAAAYLTAVIPGEYVAAARMGGACTVLDNGTQASGWWVTLPDTRYVRFYRAPGGGTNWSAASANNTSVIAQMTFEVK